ncbi:GGDEF domain-containing protein [Alteromonas portus]|uniref:diguanylate cyclase n=1 Tax=Alteromonas portus TaxID=2565549 RepID=A0A4U0Z8Z1_9ALTE|nr:diguanylate cyclase [Alteromonas portus]TKB01124.1 GGDEF domain-containing protein [Alteromonas portus]
MQKNLKAMRKYDAGLILVTVLAAVAFVFVLMNLSPATSLSPRYSQLTYLKEGNRTPLDFTSVIQTPANAWSPISSPVNLGMDTDVYWFSMIVEPTQSSQSRFLLHIDYPLLDNLDVAVYSQVGTKPVMTYSSGDSNRFSDRPIAHVKPLFPLPASAQSQRVIIKMQTSGSIRLPIRVWAETEFIEYTSSRNLVLGIFFGILLAMGVSNAFLTVTTKNVSFLFYSGYVINLAFILMTLHGYGFSYLWPGSTWFQSKAIIVFANATIMFAALFTRSLLPIKAYSKKLDSVTKAISWICGLSIIAGLILPYWLMIKAFLLLLSLVVIFILSLGVWMSLKGEVVARYFTIAWGFLLVSGLCASLDNVNIIQLPISSNNLLVIGGAVETLILALILAINYSHSRDDLIDAQQFALEQEKQANIAKESLLEVQKRYQDDLEYKVQERTLELEITLRELSEVNQELERLNAIDPLTGAHNRRHFDKRLRSEGRRSRREQTPLSLIILDVDHFKKINDEYGHDGGDACLIHVTNVFQKLIHRPTDDLCRIGGEEFAIILPNTDLDGAYHVAEKIRHCLQGSPLEYEGETIMLTASAGVSTTIIANEEQAQSLFKFADECLYEAKASGRNTVIHKHLQEKL